VDKENVVYIHNGVLFSQKEERNYVICGKIDKTGNHVKQNKPDSKRQMLYVFSQMWNLDFKKRHGYKRGTTEGRTNKKAKGE
jgi:hypothetical protein